MTKYTELLNDSAFLRSVNRDLSNFSLPYDDGEFVRRFKENVERRNEYVSEQLKAKQASSQECAAQ
jgi:hypothetical protein